MVNSWPVVKLNIPTHCKYTLGVFADSSMDSPSIVQTIFHSDWFRGTRHQLFSHANYTLFLHSFFFFFFFFFYICVILTTMHPYSVAAILSETVQKSKWIVMILGVNLGYHSKKLYPLINDQYEAFRFAVGSFIENVWFVLVYRQTKANMLPLMLHETILII